MSREVAAGLRAELETERLRQAAHGHGWDVADVLGVLGPWHGRDRLEQALHRDHTEHALADEPWTADAVVLVLALHG